MPFIDVSDGRLHYRLDGPPDAPMLLLSNSLGTDLTMWDPLGNIEAEARFTDAVLGFLTG